MLGPRPQHTLTWARVCVGQGTWYGCVLGSATTVTSDRLFEGAFSVLMQFVQMKANDINQSGSLICMFNTVWIPGTAFDYCNIKCFQPRWGFAQFHYELAFQGISPQNYLLASMRKSCMPLSDPTLLQAYGDNIKDSLIVRV